ncbi:hypothetical protein AABB24_003753, partial [Solanum stoloniferum]
YTMSNSPLQFSLIHQWYSCQIYLGKFFSFSVLLFCFPIYCTKMHQTVLLYFVSRGCTQRVLSKSGAKQKYELLWDTKEVLCNNDRLNVVISFLPANTIHFEVW